MTVYAYKVGGSLEYRHPTYVVRKADCELYNLLKKGDFCYVLNSRQMGKSSLRVRTMKELQKEGLKCASVDMTIVGSKVSNAEQWYKGIAKELLRVFRLLKKVNFADWWRQTDGLPPVQRLSFFIEDVLLVELSEKVVIFIDEIDSTINLEYKDDLFALIRACYNQRVDNSEYNRLTFCLLGVATPSDLIQDKKRTPFNIGQKIELTGFEFEKASLSLKAGLAEKVDNPEAVLKDVLNWTGGQPFLTQKLCKIVVEKTGGKTANVEEFVQKYMVENWESQDEPEHFRTIRDRLLKDEKRASKLLGIYQEIRQRGEIPGDDSYEQVELRLSGLVVNRDGKLKVYNPIYERVFNDNWVKVQLENLRPEFYREAIAAWLASGCQDESFLLRGQKLNDALKWSQDRSLSNDDNRFLRASQQLELEETRKLLDVERQAKQILEAARQEAQEGTKIERLGVNALRLFDQGREIEGLLLAMEAGQALWEFVKDDRPLQEYPATSPLFALQVILINIRERNQFPSLYGGVGSVRFSPDGQYIIVGTEAGVALLYDLYGNELAEFMHDFVIYSVSFSPDEQYIATASDDYTAKLWDLSGNLVREFRHQHPVGNVSFSPNGELLATTSWGIVRLWDLAGNQIAEFPAHEEDGVSSFSFSPDGRYIVTGSHDLTAKLWDLSGNQLAELTEHQLAVTSVCFSPDGKYIATGSDDASIRLWTLSNRESIEFGGSGGSVNSISFSPDGRYLATAADFTVRLWNRFGWQLGQLSGNLDDIYSISFSYDSRCLSAGSAEGTTWWDLSENNLAEFKPADDFAVIAIEFSHDGKYIATASSDRVKLWDLSGNCISEFDGYSPCFSSDGNYIATALSDGKGKLWDLEENTIAEFSGKPVAFSSDSQYIATTLFEQRLTKLWDLLGNLIFEFDGYRPCFSPDGKCIAIVSYSQESKTSLWDLSGNQIAKFAGNRPIFSPDGKHIATASYTAADGNVVIVWDLSGSQIALLSGHQNLIGAVAFSPDGNYIATASYDRTARLWDLSGKQIAKCVGHQQVVFSVSFSGNGEYIITTSEDLTTRLWDLLGNQIGEFKTDNSGEMSAAVSPDGRLIAMASDDGSVKIWRVETLDELLARGCEWLKYYLGNHPEAREKLPICHNLNK